jgi:hypothetical protein
MQTKTWYDREGDIVHRYTMEPNGRITRERLAPGRSAQLAFNERRRLEPEVNKDLKFGRQMLSIPQNDYHRLLHQNPELKHWEKDIRSKAWDKFMASDASKPYRIREKC